VSSPNGHEAQRDLEQRALRNVRGLVDRIERDDRLDRRRGWKLVAAVIAAVLVVFLATLALRNPRDRATREVPIAKPGQVMPQAPKAPQ
jgi:hypothetical protein